ncbi:MAG TPA: adenosylcobalamin-dependent ribonucleoside-diphosphate reductase, partial [Anaerovoracaceae bacterium]|nr:adenosylcobalamin-dependent ribonucleoside-diphosphate reductase [Anaerovoracaceae bacterium]
GIIETGKELAQLYKRRCGVGLDISSLRPEGASVNNAARTTSGAWSFADFFSYITRMVGQNSRRGALMITLSVHHPDVLKFTTMKHDLTKVTGANVSLRLSDEFLRAVEADEEYEVRWPVDSDNPKIAYNIKAKDVWNAIIESATKTAEPGLIMWDNMVNNLPAHCYEGFKTISTNPCSEIALSAYDSCRLISINLTGYVRNAFSQDAYFDIEAFKEDIRVGQQMADNLIDLELELIDRIKEVCQPGPELNLWNKLYKAGHDGRRTGLGTHGLADTLAQLNLRYDGEDGLIMVDAIYHTLRDTAYDASIDLANVRGAFPVYDYEKETKCDFINRLPANLLSKMAEHGRRNISLLTQAPTGSVSILSKVGQFDTYNVSSGVEPVFRNSYVRRKKINPGDKNARIDFVDVVGDSWQEFTVYHSNASNYIGMYGGADLPDSFVTSDQIDWERRVLIQGVEQKYIDHSISSTINLPKGTSPEVVGRLYLESWKKGLKGVTVYVDGSRDGVLITKTSGSTELDVDGRPTKIVSALAPKRPKELPCEIHHTTVKGVKWTVMVGLLQNEPYELFMGLASDMPVPTKHKTGKLVKAGKGNYELHAGEDFVVKNIISLARDDESAWATRMISTSLRHGVPVEYLVEQLSKDGSVVDINNVLARILRKYAKDSDKKKDQCPQCGGSELIYEEKCKRCVGNNPDGTPCGWSGCN